MPGCNTDSGESLLRNVSLAVSGLYSNGGESIPISNTGNPVTTLNIDQNGDRLEATDNNGLIFKGTIGQVTDDEATYTLNGRTTGGQDVTMAGTIRVPEGSTEATMTGTWIEPSLSAPLFARATVPQNTVQSNSTDNTTGELAISPSSTTATNNQLVAFSATGSSGDVTWSLSGSGTIESGQSTTQVNVRSQSGTVTLTVRDDDTGDTATATISPDS